MNITGIITEYNPLHNGHIYHINQSIKKNSSDAIVCVMSGNFVQRGFPSIVDKWERTQFALDNGVDLVIELPTVYAISSAEFFAHGSISTLETLGCVDNICFGSELGDINILFKLSEILISEPLEFKENLKFHLNSGKSFPTARNKALFAYIKNNNLFPNSLDEIDNILNSSNNILGIEYCKSLLRIGSDIKPTTIKRIGSDYNDTELSESFSSATSIRANLLTEKNISALSNNMPDSVVNRLLALDSIGYPFVSPESAFSYIKHRIILDSSSITRLPDYEEGLHNNVLKAISTSETFYAAVEKIKSKRYTYTRINRILFQIFLGFDLFDYGKSRTEKPEYIRVLGFTNKGRDVLNQIKKTCEVPIISTVKRSHNKLLAHDIRATNMYSLLNSNIRYNEDFFRRPLFNKD